MESFAKDYVDQKFETERARTEVRFAELSGKMDTLSTKMDGVNHRMDGMVKRRDIWAAAGTTIGILLAFLAFAGNRFDAGLGLSPAISQIEERQEARDAAQDARFDDLGQKLDAVLERLSGPAER
ncbi:hypothetical protein [Roseivivax isoporae]|uniref:Uncharacterized protein n=1 Tax=Roseivivax isoporae LMG 25204 TaxID=1449351 RepID=X7F398_9RHOB|nr:hypothetical protein [Roseivivax isoporae]ETX26546.1 hypothetical protein RISW2_22845 [Roseivivax isoporae LMG 25204]